MNARKLSACMLVFVLTVSAFAIASYGAKANQSSEYPYGYYWIDTNAPDPTIVYNWIDITTTGNDTGMSADDWYSGPFPIGFSFNFYGNSYSMFNLSTNGFMQFAGQSASLSNSPLPDANEPNNIIAPCWDDLVTSSGAVYYETFGAEADPDQYLVVEYNNVYRFGTSYYLTFEIVLYETGEILFQYQSMGGWAGGTATVGIEDSAGTLGVEYAYDEYVLYDGLAVMFDLGPIGLTPYSTQTASWDSTAMHTISIRNGQTLTDSFDINYTSDNGWPVTLTDDAMVPLTDSNSNGVVDTGDLLPNEIKTVHVLVEVPASPTVMSETTNLNVWSYLDPMVYAMSSLSTNTFQAQFGTDVYDYTEDVDTDGDYDYLYVDVDVQTVAEGYVHVEAAIYNGTGFFIDYTSASVYAPVGYSYVTVSFDGETLFSFGEDGPYYVDLYLYDMYYSAADQLYDYETGAYPYDGFDPPAAYFSSPHTESAVDDADSNSQYDSLVVTASIVADEAGAYIVEADLRDVALGNYIDSAYLELTLDAGPQTVDLVFEAFLINQSSWDGPYIAYMNLFTESYDWLDYDSVVTAAYLSDEFEGPRALFVSPFGEMAPDTDTDGLYNSLVVTAYIECAESGLFDIEADVYDYNWDLVQSTYQTVSLVEPATTGYNIVLDSNTIWTRGVSGNFYFYVYLYENATGYLHDSGYHMTMWYDSSSFDPAGADIVSVSDMAVDTDDDTLYNEIMVNVTIDPISSGDYHLVASVYDYNGHWLDTLIEPVYLEEDVPYYWEIVVSGEDFYLNGVDGYLMFYLYTEDVTEYYYYDYQYYETAYYYVSEFDPVGAYFGAVTEAVYDTDSDGYYNELVINATIDVLSDGTYRLYAYVQDYWGSEFANYFLEVYLEEGVPYYWELSISGYDIYWDWIESPFYVDLYTYNEEGSYGFDYEYYATADYYQGNFDAPGAYFAGTTDEGVDTDSDGGYNELVLTVTVTAGPSDDYTLEAYVYVYNGYNTWLMTVQDVVYIEEDVPYEWEIVVTGEMFVMTGMDGQIYLVMYTYDEYMWYNYDYDTYYSSSYYLDEFDRIGAYFEPPYEDYGRDDDSDGYYDWLVFVAYVNASSSGYYDISVTAYDYYSYFVNTYSFMVYLEEGQRTAVEVAVSSVDIVRYAVDGYWDFYMQVWGSLTGTWYDADWYTTEDYYEVYDFDPIGLYFDYPHEDYAYDDDDDYVYDYIVFEIALDCREAGEYTVDATLEYWGGELASASETKWMTYGNNEVVFEFDGWLMYNTYMYPGYLTLYLEATSSDGRPQDYDTHYSNYYYYDEFEGPPAEFSWPHSDWAVDDGGDAAYEYLQVNASVEAFVAGEYWVVGELYDYYYYPIDSVVVAAPLAVGVQEVPLMFDAWLIYNGYDDPYYVELYLLDANGRLVDEDSHYLSSWYYQDDFDPDPPLVESGWAYESPTIDGAVSLGEWFGAAAVDVMDGGLVNMLDATLYIMNNETHLFILVDVTGDLTESVDDFASVSFDTDNDENVADGEDDQFLLRSLDIGEMFVHGEFDSYVWDWVVDCAPFDQLLPDHEGLAGALGFGSSEALAAGHRMFELALPLGLLGTSMGDTIGFGGLSVEGPLAYDGDEEVWSSWPVSTLYYDGLQYFADLVISEERPLTTLDLVGDHGLAGWYVSSVEATLTATGGTGGVANTSYNLDGAGWQTYTEALSVEGDGIHILEFYSIDMAGNAEPVRTVLVMVDTNAPETTDVSLEGTEGQGGWFVSAVTVAFTVEDEASGVASVMYRVDGGDWTALSGLEMEITEDGDHTVEYYAVDVAGHEEASASVSVMVDVGPPVTAATVDGRTVTFSASDGNGSGVASTMYRVDDGEWTLYSGEFEVGGGGEHTVEFFSTDVAGNNETAQTVTVQGASAFNLDWWMVVLIGVILILIAIGVVFGMRRKAKGSDSLASMKTIPPVISQMELDDGRAPPQDQKPPAQHDEPPPPE